MEHKHNSINVLDLNVQNDKLNSGLEKCYILNLNFTDTETTLIIHCVRLLVFAWLLLGHCKPIFQGRCLPPSSSAADAVWTCRGVCEGAVLTLDRCWLARLPGSFVLFGREYNRSLFSLPHLFEVSLSVYVLTFSLCCVSSLLYPPSPFFFLQYMSDLYLVIM